LNSKKEPVVVFCACDVTSWISVTSVFAFSYKTFGKRIDYVFANAGVRPYPSLGKMAKTEIRWQIAQMREMRSADPTHFGCAKIEDLSTLEDQAPNLKVMDVNMTGVLYTIYAALAYYRQQEKDSDGWRGKIVATGSNACVPFTLRELCLWS
jgi:NAD(P)-dependent dehydrogenase (short-subunit alcohol dehydrogenase family)